MNYQPRKWQTAAFDIVSRCNCSNEKCVVPVNACVGSGKTAVASYALGDFIAKNRSKKTFQMFVTPRIKLCKQQAESIAEDLQSMFGFANEKDYQIVRRDCSVDNGVKFNPKGEQYAQHIILVICDESLWGTDKKNDAAETGNANIRFQTYISGFEKLAEAGYVFGNAAFDEAHNYTKKHDKIFGKKN